VEREEVDLSQIARSRVEQWEALAEESEVRTVLDAVPEARVVAMPGAAEQIIDNLIDNALAVAPPGSEIRLVVRPDRSSGSGASHSSASGAANGYELHVLDDGPGLSEEDRLKAFNRFWRGQSTTDGSGLGLAIVQQLAEASGAAASLEARPGARGLDARVTFKAAVRT
jgi:signal transduction histidine kinase